jgi:hypothetical protein
MSDTPNTRLCADVLQVLQAAPPPLRSVVGALRAAVLRAHPEAQVLAWPKQRIVSFGIGPRKMTQHHAYIGVHAQHVNLGFYRGTSLADPAALLEGTGAQLRHVKIRSVSDVDPPRLIRLIEAALDECRARACKPLPLRQTERPLP